MGADRWGMRIFALLALAAFTGCASPAVHISDSKEGWFNLHGKWTGVDNLVYCKLDESASVDPVCYEAREVPNPKDR